ncbi:MAG: response regulator transcription factor [Bacteroidales bacterium]|nr:response regulator transcription factor [Bacteroidales bacterium]
MEDIRIAIVNGSDDYRRAIRFLLEQIPDFKIVGEAKDDEEFVNLAKRIPIDVALIDNQWLVINGFTGTYEIDKTKHPHLKVILVSMYNGMGYLMAIIETGAMGYIRNQKAFKSLEKAIRAVASNKYYYGNPYVDYNYASN